MTICARCLIGHANKFEALEVHRATDDVHAWLRLWMARVVAPIPKPVIGKKPALMPALAQAKRYNKYEPKERKS